VKNDVKGLHKTGAGNWKEAGGTRLQTEALGQVMMWMARRRPRNIIYCTLSLVEVFPSMKRARHLSSEVGWRLHGTEPSATYLQSGSSIVPRGDGISRRISLCRWCGRGVGGSLRADV
jgi:hypothetical protein